MPRVESPRVTKPTSPAGAHKNIAVTYQKGSEEHSDEQDFDDRLGGYSHETA